LEQAKNALEKLGVDELGLSDADRKYLEVVKKEYGGGPVGVENIAAALTEDVETITDVYEPFLMKKGLVKRTPRGRVVNI
jgi:Holliday junction DNA helicase RuvB